MWDSHVVLVVKNQLANAGGVRNAGSIPGSGGSPGKGNGYPLQYSRLENSMDRGAWQAVTPQGCKESDAIEQLRKQSVLNKAHS